MKPGVVPKYNEETPAVLNTFVKVSICALPKGRGFADEVT